MSGISHKLMPIKCDQQGVNVTCGVGAGVSWDTRAQHPPAAAWVNLAFDPELSCRPTDPTCRTRQTHVNAICGRPSPDLTSLFPPCQAGWKQQAPGQQWSQPSCWRATPSSSLASPTPAPGMPWRPALAQPPC
ncbi:hypothetical protein HaLaN_24646 [Haematococcus lacustris]|uniref:Uncharacterized protein n=1 Tax=Haematococcus lacustris TaxID=44745 RepID=A0A6A0A3L2_HAELA|nr:hypothetical protein HaLaN_24646 [Haematococcus lacustris]